MTKISRRKRRSGITERNKIHQRSQITKRPGHKEKTKNKKVK
jgi:hypothetical protein